MDEQRLQGEAAMEEMGPLQLGLMTIVELAEYVIKLSEQQCKTIAIMKERVDSLEARVDSLTHVLSITPQRMRGSQYGQRNDRQVCDCAL